MKGNLLAVCWGAVLLVCLAAALPSRGQGSGAQRAHPVGVAVRITPVGLTLRTDAGPELEVSLPDGVPILRVPPGAKDLQTASKISVSEISVGDRVLVRGIVSDDQKSVIASTLIVMSQMELAKAREAERLEWRRRGIGGLVKAVDPQTKEITISLPAAPGNPPRPVTIALAADAVLLRYAPDSVKFSDAKPSLLEEIRVGDQVRALGASSEGGSRFTAEKLVSGTFRHIGATVLSVDVPKGMVTVNDLATGKPIVVHTNADSRLHRLPPHVAQIIAALASGTAPTGRPASRIQDGRLETGRASRRPSDKFTPPPEGTGFSPGADQGPPDIQQLIERSPTLALSELKPDEPLMALSTEGAKPSEVTAIILLAGVEPILAAQASGSDQQVVLGPWTMGPSEGRGEP